jgi:DNA topoisomerase-1
MTSTTNISGVSNITGYITRQKTRDGFIYKGANNQDLERIKSLRIPPNWKNVKIDKLSKSKIQATGYDSKERKQYIYNKDFVERNKKNKFNKMNSFDYSKYCRVLRHYIGSNNLSRDCVIANVIKLMEELNIRVGNESYKKENGTFGISTLLKKHYKNGKLTFIGKKGILHNKTIKNPNSLNFLNRVLKIKGECLFYDENCSKITSSDLNTFLKEKVQTNITCKDIRTYCANKIFNDFMKGKKIGASENERKANVLAGIKYTAQELGNTPKICRDAYLSPQNLNKYLNKIK